MRLVLVLVLAGLLSGVGSAQLIGLTAFVSFDEHAEVERVDPEPYTTGSVYFCLKNLEYDLSRLYFAVSVDPAAATVTDWVNLLPAGQSIGDWSTGIELSTPECVEDDPVAFAKADLLYLGGAGEVRIEDDYYHARQTFNCDPFCLYYCLQNNGGILMDPAPTGEPCNGIPVESRSWGLMKALYR